MFSHVSRFCLIEFDSFLWLPLVVLSRFLEFFQQHSSNNSPTSEAVEVVSESHGITICEHMVHVRLLCIHICVTIMYAKLFATWRTKILSCLEFGFVLGSLMLTGAWHTRYILNFTLYMQDILQQPLQLCLSWYVDIAYDITNTVVARFRPTQIWSSISKRCGSSSGSFQAGESAPLIEPRSDLAFEFDGDKLD